MMSPPLSLSTSALLQVPESGGSTISLLSVQRLKWPLGWQGWAAGGKRGNVSLNWGRGPVSGLSPGLLVYTPRHLWNVGWQPQPSPPCPSACLLLPQQEQPRVRIMKEGGFIDKEKAELWVSPYNTALRVQAWSQAHQGQGLLHLRDLAHPHHPELSSIFFSRDP